MTSQKDDLAQKGRKIETERNDFLMNNKLIEQQKENLETRNNALQRTNDTFKTKVSLRLSAQTKLLALLIAVSVVVRVGSPRHLFVIHPWLIKWLCLLFQISSLEKECRDAQRRLFDTQRERDEGSSQLRKVEAERNELRKRVNEVNIIL